MNSLIERILSKPSLSSPPPMEDGGLLYVSFVSTKSHHKLKVQQRVESLLEKLTAETLYCGKIGS